MRRLVGSLRGLGLRLVVDGVIIALSFYLALPMRFAGQPPGEYLQSLRRLLPLILLIYLASNLGFGIYRRIWRYASTHDAVSIINATAAATLAVMALDLLWPVRRPLPVSTVALGGFFTLAGFAGLRYRRHLIRGFARQWRPVTGRDRSQRRRQRVLVVGAGEAGQLLARRLLDHGEGEAYQVVGFVDDDPGKWGMHLHGIQILGGREVILRGVREHAVDLIVVAIYNIDARPFQEILDLCQATPARIKVLPRLSDFLDSRSAPAVLRDVTTEDLLGRKPLRIDLQACRSVLEGKRVLVTGAAGSIGAELCRQVLGFGPAELLALDNNETGLYELGLELKGGTDSVPVRETVADVTQRSRLATVFETGPVHAVFHAAAYKHVPLMEQHPEEAVRVNVLGTRILLELAQLYGAERVVIVSSDKAVVPSSVMGATKRVVEMLVAATRSSPDRGTSTGQHKPNGPRCAAVRFGNVLGSRGSVVPTFERQIGGQVPVTVTHPEMTRYFMSISEAVSLIIQAAALTQGGDLFVLDMGERIRVDDLARRLVRLRGLRPDVDVPIVYTGIRPGEKLHEELIAPTEVRVPTAHAKIYRIDQPPPAPNVLAPAVDRIIGLAEDGRRTELLEALWDLAGA